MVTGEEGRFLILFLAGTFAFCLIAVGFILFYFKSVKKVYQKQLQLEKARSEHQQELLKSAIQVEEKERRRFSRDLHDEAGAMLAAIRLKLNLLQREPANPERVKQLSMEAKEMLGDTIRSVRRISHNLLSPSLEALGLFRCLEGFFDELNSHIRASFSFNTDRERLPRDMEVALYRIVSELCNNTLKHAKAEQITLYINAGPDRLELMYRDDGKGFDRSVLPESKGLGMKNIESRVSLLKGTINFDTTPAKGMEATIKIPL